MLFFYYILFRFHFDFDFEYAKNIMTGIKKTIIYSLKKVKVLPQKNQTEE